VLFAILQLSAPVSTDLRRCVLRSPPSRQEFVCQDFWVYWLPDERKAKEGAHVDQTSKEGAQVEETSEESA
jgi:hypothetical protein